ncbi:ribosome assembly RNA-binding protein YhbY [Bacteroides heparinolyticus]|uniref:ribosome assembly RNA-binding protein YhbY n=1 Tax=Prevotella heparinolytica TaxID=28113 RepID=UPI0035A17F55
MTSKQRAYLKGLAMNIDPIFNIGKSALSEEWIEAIKEALEARELIKIGVLKNCPEDPKEMAVYIAAHTRSELVQVIGKKIVLYKQADNQEKRKIVLK